VKVAFAFLVEAGQQQRQQVGSDVRRRPRNPIRGDIGIRIGIATCAPIGSAGSYARIAQESNMRSPDPASRRQHRLR